MFPWLAAVIEDVGVGATGVFEGVGEDRHAVEGTVGVNRGGEGNDGVGEPGGIGSHWAEGAADDFSQESGLGYFFDYARWPERPRCIFGNSPNSFDIHFPR